MTANKISTTAIAIVGIGCRFPGARNAQQYWQHLCEGRNEITEIPSDRADIKMFYAETPAPGRINTRYGGFLDNIADFDFGFFGMSPREAARTDPQQRLLLEVAWEAVEDAGLLPGELVGSRAGVYVGACFSDYADLQKGSPATLDIYASVGSTFSALAGRVSYALGLQGPSITVDTACSSSLVSTHLAVQALRSGECSVALAGGVNLVLQPEATIAFCQAGMLAPDGQCKAFDARANGFVRSEGVGIVVLKPLEAAQRDGDQVYAVILGSAVNNDGRSSGLLMTPSSEGQAAVLREAYIDAGVAPEDVSYVEAHGTGTSVGDPVELEALAAVIGAERPSTNPCYIGSVKTNIGHTEAAAGVAGLIKTALCLKHRLLPPSLHFETPNPAIPWGELPFIVQTDLRPWPMEPKRLVAGVNSFGLSGTNAHMVMETPPPASDIDGESPPTLSAHLLPMSARTQEGLAKLAESYKDFIRSSDTASLSDICYTASVRRSHHEARLAAVGHTVNDILDSIDSLCQVEASSGTVRSRSVNTENVAFVFPGHGSQWHGMGLELYESEPVFRRELENCDAAIRKYTDWSLLDFLNSRMEADRLNAVDVVQPAIFAMEVALAALWRSYGIEPGVVIGQSMGEIAAAYVAGILTMEDAARVVCLRSKLIRPTIGRGGMASVDLGFEEATRAIIGYEDRVSLAVSSSPLSTVLSGDPEALDQIMSDLRGQDVFCRMVKVDFASHSPQMDELRDELLDALAPVRPQRSSLRMLSTVTCEALDGHEGSAQYWWNNLREPVLFSQSISQLVDSGVKVFIEISPHPIVLPAVVQALQHWGIQGTALPSMRRGGEERKTILSSLGTLYTMGHSVNWSGVHPAGGRCLSLPTYPWQGERCWRNDLERRPRSRAPGEHPLLGERIRTALRSSSTIWEGRLDLDALRYLRDHKVRGTVTLPAAAYVEMALSAASRLFPKESMSLEEISFQEALSFADDSPYAVQVVLSPRAMDGGLVEVFARPDGRERANTPWTLHATAEVHRSSTPNVSTTRVSLDDIHERCSQEVPQHTHYQMLEERGLNYGSSFRVVQNIWRTDGEALGLIKLADDARGEAVFYEVHPALLDGCLQVLVGALSTEFTTNAESHAYIPVGIERFRVFHEIPPNAWGHAIVRSGAIPNAPQLTGDVRIIDDSGRLVAEVNGLRLRRVGHLRDAQDWMYKVTWNIAESALPRRIADEARSASSERWLILTGQHELGENLADILRSHGRECHVAAMREKEGTNGHVSGASLVIEPFNHPLPSVLAGKDSSFDCIVYVDAPGSDAAIPQGTAPGDPQNALGCVDVLRLLQVVARAEWPRQPRICIVTQGAQFVGIDNETIAPHQALLWGLGKTILMEHPELSCRLIDLETTGDSHDATLLAAELLHSSDDFVALRGGERFTPKLVPFLDAGQSNSDPEDGTLTIPAGMPFRLETTHPGSFANLALMPVQRESALPGEVEIEVQAAGINFSDLMKVLGVYPGISGFPGMSGDEPLGLECSGRVVSVGNGVDNLHVGDEVMAGAPYSFSRFAIARAEFVAPKPPHLSFEQAATLPVAFMTADYALRCLARLERGEVVLIHTAAGGVGLAAVQIAHAAGAEVIATAGTPQKRSYLQSIGVRHAFDSRTLDFGPQILEATGGRGVDVALNTLSGDFVSKSLATLAPFGRFVEIGKTDIHQNGLMALDPFRRNLSFFAVDLDQMFREQSATLSKIFQDLSVRFQDGSLKPLPVTVFPIKDAVEGFRYISQRKNIGKVAVSLRDVKAQSASHAVVRPDGTYLITGGLGGLGLETARWFVENGARHLVLLGRSSGKGDKAGADTIRGLELAGARVMIAQADVSVGSELDRVLGEIERTMPPLRGIVHAAGILDDGVLLQLDTERLLRVLAPKVSGAWNLHIKTLGHKLDFFILYSSVASVLGSPGQGNYASANAFLDALAHYRRIAGLPAVSINWGAWSGVGLAAREETLGRLCNRGIRSFTSKQALEAFDYIIREPDICQAVVLAADWPLLLRSYQQRPSTLLAAFVGHAESVARAGFGRSLLTAESSDREELLHGYLQQSLARVLGLAPTRVDLEKPLNMLGLDSLMALELKHQIQADLDLALPMTSLMDGSSIRELSSRILDELARAPSGSQVGLVSPQKSEAMV